jgi:hypothetical protein
VIDKKRVREMKIIDVLFVIGALAGVPMSSRRYNVIRDLPKASIATKYRQHVVYRMPSETTPLMFRRIRRPRTREVILNWKILCLLMILVFGVFIGIHLLVVECEEKH